MSSIRVVHSIGDLADDLADIADRSRRELPVVVEHLADDGLRIATASARRQSGRHGKHYPKAFSKSRVGRLSWEYGPDASKPQGGMSFERGSVNQPPHNDLAKSADAIGPVFPEEVGRRVDGWFW